jgi:hypothetical protein
MNANAFSDVIELRYQVEIGRRVVGSLQPEEVRACCAYRRYCWERYVAAWPTPTTVWELISTTCRRTDSDRRSRLQRASDAPPT